MISILSNDNNTSTHSKIRGACDAADKLTCCNDSCVLNFVIVFNVQIDNCHNKISKHERCTGPVLLRFMESYASSTNYVLRGIFPIKLK